MMADPINSVGLSETNLALYSRVAHLAAATIIDEYSSSFGLASRLLAAEYRAGVQDIYALVRVADEIVDGAATEAGVSLSAQGALLDGLEAETHKALGSGYSANLVVHAFATTARGAGITESLTRPFFASMRRDLSPVNFTQEDIREYIYGSAEVIGLMCLAVFLRDHPVDSATRLRLEEGARRLGAAFQKINFLRDLAADYTQLGRRYFPGVNPETLSESEKKVLIDDIDADLAVAQEAIDTLPAGCRRAVRAAYLLFATLTKRLRDTPASQLLKRRVRVSSAGKVALVARVFVGAS